MIIPHGQQSTISAVTNKCKLFDTRFIRDLPLFLPHFLNNNIAPNLFVRVGLVDKRKLRSSSCICKVVKSDHFTERVECAKPKRMGIHVKILIVFVLELKSTKWHPLVDFWGTFPIVGGCVARQTRRWSKVVVVLCVRWPCGRWSGDVITNPCSFVVDSLSCVVTFRQRR